MAKQAKNYQELTNMIGRDMQKIIAETNKQLIKLLLTQFVDEEIYNKPAPARYKRLKNYGGFRGSWTSHTSPYQNNEITSRIFSDPNLMIFNPSEYQHGSLGEDRRANMVENIIYGINYDFFREEYPRDFWNPFVEVLDTGTLQIQFETQLIKNDIDFREIF